MQKQAVLLGRLKLCLQEILYLRRLAAIRKKAGMARFFQSASGAGGTGGSIRL